MTLNIDEILAQARRPESIVPLCLRGDLNAQFALLERRLAGASTMATSLEEISEAAGIARQMEDLRTQMRAAEVPFLLRAMEPRDWTTFYGTLPNRVEGETDDQWGDRWYAWICQMVARCSADPVMSAEQVDQLVPGLSAQQWDELTDTAWRLNTGKVSVPFSAAASRLTAATAPTSRQPEQPAPASPDSSDKSPEPSPPTSTTTPTG